jgi:hypothetical protein
METDTFIDFGHLVPEILAALGALVTVAIGWAASKFSQYTNIKIEADHRAALHQAINTGIQLAVTKFGGSGRIDVKNALVASAAEWVIKSVPDALKWFGLHDTVGGRDVPTTKVDPKLTAMIESKLPMHGVGQDPLEMEVARAKVHP